MGITRSVSVEKWANVNDTQSQSAMGCRLSKITVHVGVRTAGEWCVIHVSVFQGHLRVTFSRSLHHGDR